MSQSPKVHEASRYVAAFAVNQSQETESVLLAIELVRAVAPVKSHFHTSSRRQNMEQRQIVNLKTAEQLSPLDAGANHHIMKVKKLDLDKVSHGSQGCQNGDRLSTTTTSLEARARSSRGPPVSHMVGESHSIAGGGHFLRSEKET